jgi:hypothetical protein
MQKQVTQKRKKFYGKKKDSFVKRGLFKEKVMHGQTLVFFVDFFKKKRKLRQTLSQSAVNKKVFSVRKYSNTKESIVTRKIGSKINSLPQQKGLIEKKPFAEKFQAFLQLFIFKASKVQNKKKLKRTTLKRESLTEFLAKHEAHEESYGKGYWERYYFSVWLKRIHKVIIKSLLIIRAASWRFSVSLGALLVIFSILPSVLSAPHATSVATIEEWKAGATTTVDVSDVDGSIKLQPGGSWNARVWGVPQNNYSAGGFYSGSSSVIIGQYIYITKGFGTRTWFRYDTKRDTYDLLPELPFPLGNGADLGFDGNNTIYLTFGAYSKKFYKYDLTNETFTELPNVLDTICSGSNVESDGTNVFVNRGCGATDFWKFNVADNAWENQAPVFGSASTGASLVKASNGNLYMLRGTGTKNFYKYNISLNTWTALANSPDFPRFAGAALGSEQKGTFFHNPTDNKDYVYYLNSWVGRPNSGPDNGVYVYYAFIMKYNITDNAWSSWSVSDDAPNGYFYFASMQYSPSDGLMYVFRGASTYDLWKFDPQGGTAGVGTGGKWVGPQMVNEGQTTANSVNSSGTVNSTLGTGSDLIWNGVTGVGSYLYTIRGGNTPQFFRFDVIANTWLAMAPAPFSANTDIKGTYANGYVYYFRGSSSGEFYRYNVALNTWSIAGELASLPASATVSDGGTLVYNAADGYLYATRGGSYNTFYRYNIGTNTWTTTPTIAILSSTGLGFSSHGAAIGSRLVSNGTDLYATVGGSESMFLKYTTSTNTWSAMARTPFVQFYGTDLTYANGKIYALAGWYRDEAWEYTIASNTWRKLPPIKSFSYAKGAFNGASLEYAGGNSFFVSLGQGTAELMSFTPSSDNYVAQGTYLSEIKDLSQVENWVSFTKNDSAPANTSIIYETRTSLDSKNWDAWTTVSGTTINSTPKRYLQVRITLASSDKVNTPTVSDWQIAYNNEDQTPQNPSAVSALAKRIGGEAISSGNSYPHSHPYFAWTGASDLGSGVAGYYVYFGQNALADPQTDGIFQQTAFFETNEALQTGNYYLRIKTKDNNGNISVGAWEAFTYVYSGVSPTLAEIKTSSAEFNLGTLADVSTSDVDGSLRLTQNGGFWNEGRVANFPPAAAYGAKIVKAIAGGTTYFFALAGGNRPNFYRYDPVNNLWTTKSSVLINSVAVNISYGGSLVAGPAGFLYAMAGGYTSTFLRYDIANDLWQTVSSAPQNFSYGGTLTYDGSRYIYATPGGDNSFFRYDTVNNNWVTMGTLDFGNPEFTYQSINNGGEAFFDGGNNIYMFQGGGYPYFAKYAINNNAGTGEAAGQWTSLAPVPVAVENGGSASYNSQTKTVYFFPGWGKNYFYKYDLASDTWSKLADTPIAIGYGASSVIEGKYLYLLKGEYDSVFLRYNLEENSWELPVRGIFHEPTYSNSNVYPFSGGASMTPDGNGNAYVIRGGWDTLFNRYNPLTGKSEQLAFLPVGAVDGAQITYVAQENAVYYVTGLNNYSRRANAKNNYFFRYLIATNTWEDLNTNLPPSQLSGSGISLIYDGSRYLYLTAGGGSATWWRYDRTAVSGSRWMNHLGVLNTSLPTLAGWSQGAGSRLLFKDSLIYSTRAQNTNQFYSFSTLTNTWTRLADIPPVSPVTVVSNGSALIDGGDGYLYLTQGANAAGYFRYKIANNTWETLPSVPAQVNFGGGGAGMLAGNRIWTIAGSGTNTYNDGLYSYVLGSAQTGFKRTGVYTSQVMDLLSVYDWANLTVNYQQPLNTFVLAETRTSVDGVTWSSWEQATDEKVQGIKHTYLIASPKSEFIQVRLNFSSTDQIFSPKVDDFLINYYQDIIAPANPSAVTAYSDALHTTQIQQAAWHKNPNPSFEWPAEGQVGGAVDNVGGSAVAGYYVYFGENASADAFSLGTFQPGNTFTAANLVSGKAYYLRIKAIDKANMVPTQNFEAFTYQYDTVAPTNPTTIEVTPTGYTAVDNYAFLWTPDGTDDYSGVAKFQYRTDGDLANVWVDLSDPATFQLNLPNENHIVGAYQSGKNKFFLRAVDNAGNVSEPMMQEYYYSASAPSPPENLQVAPQTSQVNFFSFSWEQPTSFVGEVDKLTYYYSINVLPTPNNVVATNVRAAGPGAFATQKGQNTFFVVAADQAGNIEYNNYASANFFAETSAPGVPGNIQIFDTSDRENAEYSIAVKWIKPTELNLGNFDGYVIYRSEDNLNFTEIAKTTGSAYVDTKLESKMYYYYIKAKDKTNNYSIASTTVNLIPTGRYTSPPKLVGVPTNKLQSFQAEIAWVTDRVASSFVEYGKAISLGQTTGQVDSLTDHNVIVKGLEAGTKYFYRVKYIDPDGNIGTSEIDTFVTLPPPTISEVLVSDIQLNNAYVAWRTNTSATCTLNYGNGSMMSIEEAAGGSSHVQKIDKLLPATSYSIQISCLDNDKNIFKSDEYTFATPEEPIVSNVTIENKENVDLPTVIVAYQTNVPTSTYILFKGANEVSPHTYLINDRVTEHSAEITGLDPSVEYTLQVAGVDEHNIQAQMFEQKITTRFDSRPPLIITNRAIGRVMSRGKGAQANVYIRVETDEPTKIKIGYAKGIVTKSFEQTASDDAFNTYHLITIPAETGQVYSYQISAFDEAENVTTSEAMTIAVDQSRANATEVITSTFLNQFGWISKLGRN